MLFYSSTKIPRIRVLRSTIVNKVSGQENEITALESWPLLRFLNFVVASLPHQDAMATSPVMYPAKQFVQFIMRQLCVIEGKIYVTIGCSKSTFLSCALINRQLTAIPTPNSSSFPNELARVSAPFRCQSGISVRQGCSCLFPFIATAV